MVLWLILLVNSIQSGSATVLGFGILTVTKARDKTNDVFMTFLNRYASMECPELLSINIVWQNQQSPKEMDAYMLQSSWTRPVRFVQMKTNSMDNRYFIPEDCDEQLLLSMDDDISITCQEMQNGFKQWRKVAVGELAPLVGWQMRAMSQSMYPTAMYPFFYDWSHPSFYNLVLAGITFIPRIYLQIYYTNLPIFQQIRKHVSKVNNCDDLALNFIISFLFPELLNVNVNPLSKESFANISPRIGQSLMPNHLPLRHQCISMFSIMLGYAPMRYAAKHTVQLTYVYPFKNETLKLRLEQFRKYTSFSAMKRERNIKSIHKDSVVVQQEVLQANRTQPISLSLSTNQLNNAAIQKSENKSYEIQNGNTKNITIQKEKKVPCNNRTRMISGKEVARSVESEIGETDLSPTEWQLLILVMVVPGVGLALLALLGVYMEKCF